MSTGNRNPVKQWFITFPKSGSVSREEFVATLPPMEGYYVCMESHDDGEPHLHVCAKLKHGKSFSKMGKWFAEKWPEDNKRIKYEIVRDWDDVLCYSKKEDTAGIAWGNLAAVKKKKYTEADAARDITLMMLERSERNNSRKLAEREVLDARRTAGWIRWTGEGHICTQCEKPWVFENVDNCKCNMSSM